MVAGDHIAGGQQKPFGQELELQRHADVEGGSNADVNLQLSIATSVRERRFLFSSGAWPSDTLIAGGQRERGGTTCDNVLLAISLKRQTLHDSVRNLPNPPSTPLRPGAALLCGPVTFA
jgi:hypothetical protein